MRKLSESVLARRRFLKLLGGSAALISLAGLTGCAGEEPASDAQPTTGSEPKPAAPAEKPAAPATGSGAEAMPTPPAAGAAGGNLPRLSPDDTQAKTLGYVHDAGQVDKAAFPRYEPAMACRNCSLYLGQGDAEWAGCAIFPGKAVNANGWCNAYAPKG